MKYGLIGEHLSHSFSKTVHAAIADYEYELLELSPNEVEKFIKSREYCAVNVTIPYKETVMPHLDFIDGAASAIGAVNTVVNRDGVLYGYNTDFFGLLSLIEKLNIKIKNKKVLILGTGGTSKTAKAVVSHLGASDVITVSRREGSGATYETMYEQHTDADVIINTTPVGMYPNIIACPVELRRFERLSGVIDAVYNPLRTELVSNALSLGIKADGGLYMLVAQAVAACERFLDKKIDDYVLDRVYGDIIAEKENIVLVGMPSCGKTTVGKLIAEKTGRAFCDLDDEIVKVAKKPITEIFSESGELAFRDLESEVTKRIAPMGGVVIATGGGAVLREENVKALKQNGRLYFLDRPLSQLLPTPDRPVASSREAIEARYQERLPIYNKVADVKLLTDGVAEHAAADIIKLHFGAGK